jgi:MFS superfamily sulfate permease-like transporter
MKTSNNLVLANTWKQDILAGFMVFLLALPLSLGIAKASGFPAAMGILTAIIGGLVTTIFKVSPLTIKGPAAGLITICSGAVLEFGGLETGWKVAAAALMIAALIQILMAFLKLGSISDFFPHAAVHGILAAIGIIIIAKQIPVLLGDDPAIYKGEGPIELLLDIPKFLHHAHLDIALIGVIALLLMFLLPKAKWQAIKKVPAPMIVLLITIPLGLYFHLKDNGLTYSLVSIGDFWGSFGWNANFEFIGQFAFWKYVFMFLFVNTLESLLTVKAVDSMDPQKRSSDYNGDLLGLGAGNLVSGALGGMPMISEVVRSSSNVGFGAQTKFANFFHGLFLLIAMILIIPLIEMIPNAALAAMLIVAGVRLAAPKEFVHMYKIGWDQLVIFLATIIVTLVEDLLLGIATGIVLKFVFHLLRGAGFRDLFQVKKTEQKQANSIIVFVEGAGVFSNLIGWKKYLGTLNGETNALTINLANAKLIDHSFLSFLKQLEQTWTEKGSEFHVVGLSGHQKTSKHDLAVHRKK